MAKSARSRRAFVPALALVAAGAVALSFWGTRGSDHALHLDVVSRVQRLQELDARRDEQLVALRFGLSAQYDALADVEREMQVELETLERLRAPDQHSADPLRRDFEPVASGLAAKAEAVEVFLDHLVSLNGSIQCFPKSVEMFHRAVQGAGDPSLELRIASFASDVLRTLVQDGRRRRAEVLREIDALEADARTLAAPTAQSLEPVIVQARLVLDHHAAIDEELRALLDHGDRARLTAFRSAYVAASERDEARLIAVRRWIYGGTLVLVLGVAFVLVRTRFINERIENEVRERTRELEASRAQYRSLVESTQAVPWQWSAARDAFDFVGPQAGELLGCPTQDWLEPGFVQARLHPEDAAAVLAALRAPAAISGELEFRLARAGGAWVWVRCISGVDASRPDLRQGLLFDVTERRQMELELRQAQKLESVGRLAAGVAHEINTPVQFVGDSIQFVRDAFGDLLPLVERYAALRRTCEQGAPEPAQLEQLKQAEEDADVSYITDNVGPALERSLDGLDRVASIVRSLKEFAHPEQREQAPADLNRALETALTITRSEHKYVADVETSFEDLPAVLCHVGELNQVFLNLIVNAAHAIGDVIAERGGKGLIRVRTRREADEVVIEIADDGGGIPEAIRTRIFEPFFTTKEVGRGTGQGLAISRGVVVDKHGGTLTFETELGRGTTFIVRLPIGGVGSAARSGSAATAA